MTFTTAKEIIKCNKAALPRGFDKPKPDDLQVALSRAISELTTASGVCIDRAIEQHYSRSAWQSINKKIEAAIAAVNEIRD